jgi:hypothetical protein
MMAIVPTRKTSFRGSSRAAVSMSAAAGSSGTPAPLVEAICQQFHLDLLDQDRDDPVAVAHLQKEGAIAGLAESAGHKSVWVLEIVDA